MGQALSVSFEGALFALAVPAEQGGRCVNSTQDFWTLAHPCYEHPMSAEKKPEVVDLSQYKRARADAEQQTRAKAKADAKAAREPLLGRRPKAGLILGLLILVLAAVVLLPRLL